MSIVYQQINKHQVFTIPVHETVIRHKQVGSIHLYITLTDNNDQVGITKTTHHQSQVVWACHVSPMPTALAASPQTSEFQDIHPRLSFIGWHHSCIPSWRMYTGYHCWLPSSAICWQSNMHGKRSCNQFGDRCFDTARPTLWNSLPEELWQHLLRTI